jgi:hypothetical protein
VRPSPTGRQLTKRPSFAHQSSYITSLLILAPASHCSHLPTRESQHPTFYPTLAAAGRRAPAIDRRLLESTPPALASPSDPHHQGRRRRMDPRRPDHGADPPRLSFSKRLALYSVADPHPRHTRLFAARLRHSPSVALAAPHHASIWQAATPPHRPHRCPASASRGSRATSPGSCHRQLYGRTQNSAFSSSRDYFGDQLESWLCSLVSSGRPELEVFGYPNFRVVIYIGPIRALFLKARTFKNPKSLT